MKIEARATSRKAGLFESCGSLSLKYQSDQDIAILSAILSVYTAGGKIVVTPAKHEAVEVEYLGWANTPPRPRPTLTTESGGDE